MIRWIRFIKNGRFELIHAFYRINELEKDTEKLVDRISQLEQTVQSLSDENQLLIQTVYQKGKQNG